MARNILADMTDMLYEQAKKLREASQEDVELEVERAKAMEQLSAGIRSNVGTAIAIERLRNEYGVPSQKLLANG